MKKYSDFNFPSPLEKALERMGFDTPTDVQAQTIPLALEGRDILATAQTGTGKTAAFAVPILAKFLESAEAGGPAATAQKRALIIAPTRELAEQIGEVIRELTWTARRFRYTVIIGGSAYGKQIRELRMDPYFVVGTPGRLIDHMKTGMIRLEDFGYLVLDEADRMLDMGFEPQIEELVARMPKDRQTMMFSATLPETVKKMVSRYLKSPARVSIGEENVPIDKIKQDVIELKEGDKKETLLREIDKLSGTMIIFTRTKIRADLVADMLNSNGHVADALHGDLSQAQRKRAITRFRDEGVRILVATDIAARGLDVQHVQHVINYDLPMVPEDYIHRIGRTGRNGAEGHSLSLVNPTEKHIWFRILRLMGKPAPLQEKHEGKFRAGRFADEGGPRRPAFGGGRGGSRPGQNQRQNQGGAVGSRPARPVGAEDRPAFAVRGERGARPTMRQAPRSERPESIERDVRPKRAFQGRPGAHVSASNSAPFGESQRGKDWGGDRDTRPARGAFSPGGGARATRPGANPAKRHSANTTTKPSASSSFAPARRPKKKFTPGASKSR